MRFHEIDDAVHRFPKVRPLITESSAPWDSASYFDKMVEFWKTWKVAKRRCSDFIAMCKQPPSTSPMLRGFRAGKDHPPAFRGTSETRLPEEGERREEVDAWLTAHGFAALRDNSLFCANKIDQAYIYAKEGGAVYYVLPENGFEYTWYENSHDLYQANFDLSLGRKALAIDELMQHAKPTNKDIKKVLQSNRLHEIHFVGGYIAFSRDHYSQLLHAELTGQGVQNQVRWGRIPPEVCKRLDLKYPQNK